jgi:hypothetical protein
MYTVLICVPFGFNGGLCREAPIAGHMSDDRKLNVETFGPAAANLRRFGQRTRYRGMSRGGRGGYQRGRWPR